VRVSGVRTENTVCSAIQCPRHITFLACDLYVKKVNWSDAYWDRDIKIDMTKEMTAIEIIQYSNRDGKPWLSVLARCEVHCIDMRIVNSRCMSRLMSVTRESHQF
jgi:hypothetical protein